MSVRLFARLLAVSAICIATTAIATDLTQANREGQVVVRVTYDNPGEPSPRFSVRLDTHTVNLDTFDPAAHSLLRDDRGNEYRGTWEETGGSGHHRQGTLTFGPVGMQQTQALTLEIRNLAGVGERRFRWTIQ